MPNDRSEVQVFDAVAVDVKFVVAGETRNAFDHGALGAVAHVEKGRNHGDPVVRHDTRVKERRGQLARCPARADANLTLPLTVPKCMGIREPFETGTGWGILASCGKRKRIPVKIHR